MRRFFAGFCAFGIGTWIALQAFISIGVNLGLLPTKGLTLPFISYGGSSLLITCAALGLLLRVSYELTRAERQVAIRRGETAAAPQTPEAGIPSMHSVRTAADDARAAVAHNLGKLLRRGRPSGDQSRQRIEPVLDKVERE